jgi:threonyl-tRNA synthetase
VPVIEKASKDDLLYRVRHSLAHVMAQAVTKHFPGTLLGFGPPIDDGFYYDFLFPEGVTLGDDDLPRIEKEMRKIIAQDQTFVREDLAAADALARIEAMQEPHKLEYARELIKEGGHESLSFYTNGPFVDMCEGPHVDSTKALPKDGFKLHSVAGAYWRGDEKNVMLSRIYAYAFPDKAALKAHRAAVEQAKHRDHRKLGRDLGIYVIDDEVGKGLPLWLPNGAIIRRELEKLAYETEFRYGYVPVATPHITKESLYWTSGHLPLYEQVMYPPIRIHEEAEAGGAAAESGDGDAEKYYLKPMNCPHHHVLFRAEPRSYRDLPLRFAEYGTVYRFERSGQLQGLTRVRGMAMNDAHLYVTPDQLLDELKAVMQMHREYYELFGFDDYYMRLSLWDPDDPKRASKYIDQPADWDFSQKIVRQALEELDLWYTIEPGEAAFYGPKIDVQFRTVTGRDFTVSTNQLDFAQPARFGLTYTDSDGEAKTPYCIHRAPLGTHERFIAFLIEHYGGAFPTWLAPVQVVVIPVSDDQLEYAEKVRAALRADMIRTDVDSSDASMGKKIRTHVTRKVPVLLVVGGREAEDNTVTVRRYGVEAQESMGLDSFISVLRDEIRERRHVRDA